MAEKFIENLADAEKILYTADHMIYITFPLINDKRLLLKIIQEIKKSVINCITSILHYEYAHMRVTLYKDPSLNFRIFSEKCAPSYNITKDEIRLILELFDFVEKHRESSFEFMRNDKVVIMSGNMRPKTLTIEKAKDFLILGKNLLKKTRAKFFGKI